MVAINGMFGRVYNCINFMARAFTYCRNGVFAVYKRNDNIGKIGVCTRLRGRRTGVRHQRNIDYTIGKYNAGRMG